MPLEVHRLLLDLFYIDDMLLALCLIFVWKKICVIFFFFCKSVSFVECVYVDVKY